MGLALHLADPAARFDEAEFSASAEAKDYMTASSEAWGEAAIAAGDDPEVARRAAGNTAAFYTGTAPAGG